jgi:serine/threonine protein kinase/beta-lactam-binding protein with PASTA domain
METFEKYVGQVFDRRYRIVKIIGIGGMAVVFEAIDTVMKRTVAVKMLKDEIANDAQSVKRFINESKAVSMLSHPNIVSIYDVSVKENLKYIVMERVDGITLKNYMNKKGALGFKEVISYTEQILKALEHAHQKGIIHRDIKPQNIMLLKNGRIKVADFGIAKLPNAETVTMTDKAIGTVYYISPEQASGKQIDPRSDLYSLGVVMYEMATGQLPFTADSPVSVALMQVSTQPRRPRELNSSIPAGLEQIILAAMEKVPERRIQSAAQMLHLVTRIKANPAFVFKTRRPDTESMTVHDADNLPALPKPRRRHSGSMLPIIAGVTAAFMIVIGISGFYVFKMLFETNESETARTIDIEKYVGMLYDDNLKAEIDRTNYFRVDVKYVYDTEHEENTIIAQDPAPGEKRKVLEGRQYCDLRLTVSLGVQTVRLPDFTVMEYRSVENELRSLGLKPVTTNEFHETIQLGYVIKTEPAAGTELKAGDTVTLFVSKGENIRYVSVPDFSGMTEEKAMSTLTSNDLALGSVTYEPSDIVERGRIISQSRTAYSEVPAKTKIDFVVSSGGAGGETKENNENKDNSENNGKGRGKDKGNGRD